MFSQFKSDDKDREVSDLQDAVSAIQKRLDELEISKGSVNPVAQVSNMQQDIQTLYLRIDIAVKRKDQEISEVASAVFEELNRVNIELEKRSIGLKGDILAVQSRLNTEISARIQQYLEFQKTKRKDAIAECIANIKAGNLPVAVEKYKQLGDTKVELLNQIVAESYDSSIKNFENIANFGRWMGLPHSESIIVYTTLFEEMKKNRHLDNPEIFRLAFKVKEAMEMHQYSGLNSQIKAQFEALRSAFPEGVRRILWDNYINLYCSQSGGYLDADPEATQDYGHMQRNSNRVSGNPYLNWTPCPIQEGLYFAFLNKKSDHYLDGGPHHARKNRSGEQEDNRYLHWQIKPQQNGAHYVLQCRANNCYLDGGPDHSRGFRSGEETSNPYLRWKIS